MNLEELKTKFPKVYKACVDIGIEQERDRATAHLQAGEKVGALKMAITAILNGEDLTPTHMGHYLQAARRGAELAAWIEDDDVVLDATEHAKRPPSRFTDPQAAAVYGELQRLVGGLDGDIAIEDLEADELNR